MNGKMESYLYGSASIERSRWPAVVDRVLAMKPTLWNFEPNSNFQHAMIEISTDSSRVEFENLIRSVDPAFSFVQTVRTAGQKSLAAVAYIVVVPDGYRTPHYFRPIQWQKMVSEIEALSDSERPDLKVEVSPMQVTVGVLSADRMVINELSRKTARALVLERNGDPVFVILFTVDGTRLDGVVSVGAPTETNAVEIFQKNILSLDSYLDGLTLDAILIDDIVPLAEYETEFDMEIDAEDIPKPGEIILIDIGS